MATVHAEIDERLRAFIAGQPVFFVATAPSGPGGHVNVSPKGYSDTFAVLGPLRVAYLDLSGSGAETAAHLRDNGRITIMFCAFSGKPSILRLYGRGRVVVPHDSEFDELASHFSDRHPGMRSVIVVDLDRISDSCGYAVPTMDLVGERAILDQHAAKKGPEQLAEGWRDKNATSIDGLPALPLPLPALHQPSGPLAATGES